MIPAEVLILVGALACFGCGTVLCAFAAAVRSDRWEGR